MSISFDLMWIKPYDGKQQNSQDVHSPCLWNDHSVDIQGTACQLLGMSLTICLNLLSQTQTPFPKWLEKAVGGMCITYTFQEQKMTQISMTHRKKSKWQRPRESLEKRSVPQESTLAEHTASLCPVPHKPRQCKTPGQSHMCPLLTQPQTPCKYANKPKNDSRAWSHQTGKKVV